MSDKRISHVSASLTRRSVLSTGARAAAAAGLLPAAALLAGQSERILIGVHLFGPAFDGRLGNWVGDAAQGQMVISERAGEKPNDDRYSHLRFVAGGFVAAGFTAGQHTYTFREGFTLSSSTKVEGSLHDNDVLRAALDDRTALPKEIRATGLGRQLNAAAQLAAQAHALGLKNVSILTTLGGFGAKRDHRRKGAEKELSQSLDAFRQFTDAQGLNERVVIYTDFDVHQGVAAEGNQSAHACSTPRRICLIAVWTPAWRSGSD